MQLTCNLILTHPNTLYHLLHQHPLTHYNSLSLVKACVRACSFLQTKTPRIAIPARTPKTCNHPIKPLIIKLMISFWTCSPSFACGKGSSGIGTLRILQRGSQPSLTLKKCNFSGGVTRFMCSMCFSMVSWCFIGY